MRNATLGLAAVILAGFLVSDAMAQHPYRGTAGHYAARGGNSAHHRHSAHHYSHGSHHRSPHGRYDYDRYYGHNPYRAYRPPVIVTPPACGYPSRYDVYRHNYHPLNSFYYGGRNFGIGISF